MTRTDDYIISLIRALMRECPVPPIPEGLSLGELFDYSKSHCVEALVFRGLSQLLPHCEDPVWKGWERPPRPGCGSLRYYAACYLSCTIFQKGRMPNEEAVRNPICGCGEVRGAGCDHCLRRGARGRTLQPRRCNVVVNRQYGEQTRAG